MFRTLTILLLLLAAGCGHDAITIPPEEPPLLAEPFETIIHFEAGVLYVISPEAIAIEVRFANTRVAKASGGWLVYRPTHAGLHHIVVYFPDGSIDTYPRDLATVAAEGALL